MPEYIKTAGDIRRGVAHLSDDQPVEFFINNVATGASFGAPGVNGGDLNINVEPNYTCNHPWPASPRPELWAIASPDRT